MSDVEWLLKPFGPRANVHVEKSRRWLEAGVLRFKARCGQEYDDPESWSGERDEVTCGACLRWWTP